MHLTYSLLLLEVFYTSQRDQIFFHSITKKNWWSYLYLIPIYFINVSKSLYSINKEDSSQLFLMVLIYFYRRGRGNAVSTDGRKMMTFTGFSN